MPSHGHPRLGILLNASFCFACIMFFFCSISAQKDQMEKHLDFSFPQATRSSAFEPECELPRGTPCHGEVFCLYGGVPIIIIVVFIVFTIIESLCHLSIHLLILLVVIFNFLSLDSPVVPAALALQLDQRRTEHI